MKPVEIVCHKGANEYAPENTIASTQLCIDWGMDYVEIDVSASKDGVLYLMHDPDVDRTTNGHGLLRDMLSEDIDCLDAGSWFDPSFTEERVPRLEPFLRCQSRGRVATGDRPCVRCGAGTRVLFLV
jgi:glycerophosphoryl diester phosphodiesterase